MLKPLLSDQSRCKCGEPTGHSSGVCKACRTKQCPRCGKMVAFNDGVAKPCNNCNRGRLKK